MKARNYVLSATGYSHDQMVFKRQRDLDGAPPEKLQPMLSWCQIMARAAILVAVVALLAVLA